MSGERLDDAVMATLKAALARRRAELEAEAESLKSSLTEPGSEVSTPEHGGRDTRPGMLAALSRFMREDGRARLQRHELLDLAGRTHPGATIGEFLLAHTQLLAGLAEPWSEPAPLPPDPLEERPFGSTSIDAEPKKG